MPDDEKEDSQQNYSPIYAAYIAAVRATEEIGWQWQHGNDANGGGDGQAKRT